MNLETVYSISGFTPTRETYVTTGAFDGVHKGHQKIIKNLVEQAESNRKKSVLLTFFPHPRMVLQKESSVKLINTIQERIDLLKKTKLDCLIIHPFSKEFSRLTALDFVRGILVNQLKVSKLIIGYDHHFGKNREGNIKQLSEFSNTYNFEVEEIPVQDIDTAAVSSTKIRDALKSGNLKTANNYLGYSFPIEGIVVKGNNLGSKIGYPTANIHLKEKYKLIPKSGVYIVKATIEGIEYPGMMNIGYRPTINGKNQTIEIHFFNYSGNLYGKTVKAELLYFLRDEKKFDSVEDLVRQLSLDKDFSLQYINSSL